MTPWAQAVLLTIYRRFAAEKIEFAYPTRTVVVKPAELDGRVVAARVAG